LIFISELKFRGALNLYIDNFKAILKSQEELSDFDLDDLLEDITESNAARDSSVRSIFEHIATGPVRGIKALASMRSLKDIFKTAEENGIQSRDEYALFWLERIRITDSSDRRGKVYAVLGLLEDSNKMCQSPITNPNCLIINYNASVEDVYSSLVRAMVESSKRLGILSACTKRSELVTRTWTPDWTKYPPHRPILTTEPVTVHLGAEFGTPILKHNYSATGERDAVVSSLAISPR
jgi:hypothetical protein